MTGLGFGGAFGLAVVLLHGLALAALFSAFGSLLFLAILAPPALARLAPAEREAALRPCSAVSRWSLALAVLLELAWLAGESGVIAGASGLREIAAALPVVVRATAFGHLVLAQALALILALIVAIPAFRHPGSARSAAGPAAALAGLATALEAWHLHGAAMHAGLSPLLLSELCHVLAAGAWLGSLLPLALFVRAAPAAEGRLVARRFSRFATPCVLVLAATAFWQGDVLIGSLAALTGTAYGGMALVKLGLFIVLIGFAARNRWRLTPALSGAGAPAARRALTRSIARETVAGLVIVLAAAMISSLPPPADMAMSHGMSQSMSRGMSDGMLTGSARPAPASGGRS